MVGDDPRLIGVIADAAQRALAERAGLLDAQMHSVGRHTSSLLWRRNGHDIPTSAGLATLARTRCSGGSNPIRNASETAMNQDAKKTALRMIPYGIYVLTADDGAGNVSAATVNWVTQTAFNPPLVVVGVKTDSHAYPLLKN